MLGIATLLYLNWQYADHKNFIEENVNAEQIAFTKIVNFSFILIAILALALSFVIPSYSQVVFIIMLPIDMIVKKIMGI
jgi:uncharacterized membrane protein